MTFCAPASNIQARGPARPRAGAGAFLFPTNNPSGALMTKEKTTKGGLKPTAYAYVGPDGLHFNGLRPAAAWLGVNAATLIHAARAIISGGLPKKNWQVRLVAEFPDMVHPFRIEGRAEDAPARVAQLEEEMA